SEGTPVLALGRGGARETVQTRGPQRTGMFFDVPEPEAIAECVRRFLLQESYFTREACWAQAETFSAELFRSRFSNFVDDQMALHRAAC
ncbi:glycosyltransferase family 4 protein, partial [Escherichia coli]|nr:glycosyltransferase family 4 protein [Escherichia coli]